MLFGSQGLEEVLIQEARLTSLIVNGNLRVGVCRASGGHAAHSSLRRGLGVVGCVPEKVSVPAFFFRV